MNFLIIFSVGGDALAAVAHHSRGRKKKETYTQGWKYLKLVWPLASIFLFLAEANTSSVTGIYSMNVTDDKVVVIFMVFLDEGINISSGHSCLFLIIYYIFVDVLLQISKTCSHISLKISKVLRIRCIWRTVVCD